MSDLNRQLRQLTAAGAPAPETVAALTVEESQHPRPRLSSPYAPPANETEKNLVEIWQMTLGFQPIGVNDNFFELKGDSLKAIGILAKINKQMNISVPLSEFFERPTVEKLSRYVRQQSGTDRFVPVQPVEKKEYYPLSPAQKRIFFVQQKQLDSIAYNLQQIIPLQGKQDQGKLEEIFIRLLKRHESLRTFFTLVAQDPVQRIKEDCHFKIQYPEVKEEDIASTVKRVMTAFDLRQAPLLKVALIKTGEENVLLLVNTHHIVSDGISMSIVTNEFRTLYQGGELAPLKTRYTAYSEGQKKQQHKDTLKKQEKYWLKLYQDQVPVLHLPTDYPRPALQSFAGNTIAFRLASGAAAQLKALAAREEVTLYMLLLAIFKVLLAKVSLQEDIVVGTGSEGRGHEDLRQVIGMFVNTITIRSRPGAEKTFAGFLAEIKILKAFDNQDFQFEDLVEKVIAHRDASRNPLFDVMFQLENSGKPGSDSPVRQFPAYEKKIAKFDLTLFAFDLEDELSFTFEYGTKLFKQETIDLFITFFKRIVVAVTANPGTRLAEIEIISPGKKAERLKQLNDDLEKEMRSQPRTPPGTR